MDEMLSESMKNLSVAHKAAINKERARREELEKQKQLKKRQEDEERRKRKEKRAALRERHRLQTLKDKILEGIINTAAHEDYLPKYKIYDVKQAEASNDGVIVIGGFIGELIISFTCMLDYILASPAN